MTTGHCCWPDQSAGGRALDDLDGVGSTGYRVAEGQGDVAGGRSQVELLHVAGREIDGLGGASRSQCGG